MKLHLRKISMFSIILVIILGISACGKKQITQKIIGENNEETSINEEEPPATPEPATEDDTNDSGESEIKNITPLFANKKIEITLPTKGEDYVTKKNRVIIWGKAPSGTNSISVNGFRLQKFFPGQKIWSYIASTKIGTLKKGENEYLIKALGKGNNIINEKTYRITFNPDMPNRLAKTGTSLAKEIILLSGILSFIILRRKKSMLK